MKTKTLVVLCGMFVSLVCASAAEAADVCAIHRAANDGDGVKVVFSKGFPPAAITYPNGAKVFVNTAAYKPPGYMMQNPHAFVTLHKGDKLEIIGVDSGCTVTVVRVRNALELKMDGGKFVHFLPVEGGKTAVDSPSHS